MMPSLRCRAMHIAIILHDFSTGGSERIAIRLANQWVEQGRRVTLLCGVAEGPARALVDPRVSVIGLWPPIPRSPFSRIALGRALAGCVETLRPDLVFSPGNFHISVLGIMARLLGPDRPATISKISNPLRRPDRSGPAQSVAARLLRWFTMPIDGFVAMSEALRIEAAQVLRRSRIETIYEPNVDMGARAVPSHSRPPRHGPTILCAGRLVPQKAFDRAIRAFALLDRDLGARLKIMGEGPQRVRLETLVEKLGLNDRVSFTGHLADIRPALGTGDLFLLSSDYEGYPAVIVEALAAGLPCVATDCSPALSEIIGDDGLGEIVAASPRALADAMTRRLAMPARVDASKLLDRHRVDAVAQRYLDYFDQTMATRSALRGLSNA